jgi:transposase-like protein
MKYKKYSTVRFFREINTETKAREIIWQSRFGEKGFECPRCGNSTYYELETRPEIRKCRECGHQLGVKSGTIFHRSHISLLTWVRAIFLVTKSKRGVSALEIQRELGFSRYGTASKMMRKIRTAFKQRDESYQIDGIIELDGAHFGKKDTDTHARVLVGVETKRWWTDDGKIKQRAGFAKVFIGTESSEDVQSLVNSSIKEGATLKTDGFPTYTKGPKGVDTFSKVMGGDQKRIDYWLPWVHKFISNAKTWILGTHHGLNSSKYLDLYLAEYTYRFNRRHDLGGLFHRGITACSLAKPMGLVS